MIASSHSVESCSAPAEPLLEPALSFLGSILLQSAFIVGWRRRVLHRWRRLLAIAIGTVRIHVLTAVRRRRRRVLLERRIEVRTVAEPAEPIRLLRGLLFLAVLQLLLQPIHGAVDRAGIGRVAPLISVVGPGSGRHVVVGSLVRVLRIEIRCVPPVPVLGIHPAVLSRAPSAILVV